MISESAEEIERMLARPQQRHDQEDHRVQQPQQPQHQDRARGDLEQHFEQFRLQQSDMGTEARWSFDLIRQEFNSPTSARLL